MTGEMFINMFHLNNYTELECAFQEAKKYFENFSDRISFDEIRERFPVIIDKNLISIMFPTYKIWILDESIPDEKIRELLKDIDRIKLDIETNVVKWPSLKRIHPRTIHCQDTDLVANTAISCNVEKILKDNLVKCERCIETGYYYVFASVDEKGYIVDVMR